MFSAREFPLVATTMQGLEEVLADELRALGARKIKIGRRAVEFVANNEVLYRANLCCRLAMKILFPLHAFEANSEQELYQGVYDFDWKQVLNPDLTFAMDKVVHGNIFTHSQFAALKTKDAIVDNLRKEFGRRPSVDLKNPDIPIHLRISGNKVELALNSSGMALFKRGYRVSRGVAPINEVLAAGMIRLSGWDEKTPFKDPMCGSGTIALEAAMIASNTFPGILRKDYGFQNWPNYDRQLLTELMLELPDLKRPMSAPITCCDRDPKVLNAAKDNIRAAGFSRYDIESRTEDFFKSRERQSVFMITNPPYGERIQVGEIEKLYEKLGSHLKRYYAGSEVWVISSSKEGMKSIGLHAGQKHTLFNGALECKFRQYSLYDGSKKASKRGRPPSKLLDTD